MRSFCQIHSEEALDAYYYTPLLQECITGLYEFLPRSHQINLFPEATIKTNLMPNGILIKSVAEQTVFLPSLLRDPGCGFLLFQLNDVPKDQIKLIADGVLSFCAQLEKKEPNSNKNELVEAIKYGVSHIRGTEKQFSQSCFPIDLNALYLDFCPRKLKADLTNITNTLELKISGEHLDEPRNIITLHGFLHTGSEYLPAIIAKYWLKNTAILNRVQFGVSDDQISRGYYGLPQEVDEAYEYQQFVYAAMNYCLYKRYWLFQQLTKYVQNELGLDIQLVNDRCHAGLFVKKEGEKTYFLQSRGVQILDDSDKGVPILLAGHKESISYFLKKHKTEYIGHGTSLVIKSNKDYKSSLPKLFHSTELPISANTALCTQKVLPYNYNIYHQMSYLKNKGADYQILYPILNYQGKFLRKVSYEKA